MHKRVVVVDLPEDRCPMTEGLSTWEKNWNFDFLLEREFSPGQDTEHLPAQQATCSGSEMPRSKSVATFAGRDLTL